MAYDGRLDIWATLHPERLGAWGDARGRAGRNTDFRPIVHAAYPGLKAEVHPQGWYGSSGLYMADVALKALGATHAILCGVPMTSEAGHFAKGGPWCDPAKYRSGFEAAHAEGANIRSMSGWTAELFGAPDEDWLEGREGAASLPMKRSDEMHVRFLEDFDYTPSAEPRVQVAYKTGWQGLVRTECGALALEAGKAVEIDPPKRPLSPAQIEALDGDRDGSAGGSLPKAQRKVKPGA